MKKNKDKVKNNNNSTLKEKIPTISAIPYHEFKYIYPQNTATNTKYVNALSEDIIRWAWDKKKNHDQSCSYRPSEYYHELNIPCDTWEDWLAQYPDLKKSYERARKILGLAREAGALHNRLNSGMVRQTLHQYSKEWDEANKYHAELDKNNNTPGEIHVHLPSAEDLKE